MRGAADASSVMTTAGITHQNASNRLLSHEEPAIITDSGRTTTAAYSPKNSDALVSGSRGGPRGWRTGEGIREDGLIRGGDRPFHRIGQIAQRGDRLVEMGEGAKC